MRSPLSRAFALMVPLLPIAATADSSDAQHYGQYYCVVEHVAGIKQAGGQMTSGEVSLRESDMKFFIKVGPVVRDDLRRKICMDTMDYYRVYFEKGLSFDERLPGEKSAELRQWIGLNCFTSEEITVTYPSAPTRERNWVYKGYGASPEHFGAGTGSWFNFYWADDSFEMGFYYDFGPVIEYGHCTKIEPPK